MDPVAKLQEQIDAISGLRTTEDVEAAIASGELGWLRELLPPVREEWPTFIAVLVVCLLAVLTSLRKPDAVARNVQEAVFTSAVDTYESAKLVTAVLIAITDAAWDTTDPIGYYQWCQREWGELRTPESIRRAAASTLPWLKAIPPNEEAVGGYVRDAVIALVFWLIGRRQKPDAQEIAEAVVKELNRQKDGNG